MTNRNVIVHVHIFKNAGSSFDDTLLTNFNEDFVDHREDNLINNDKFFLENYLKKNKNVKAFSSHSVYHKPKGFNDTKLHTVYFLRHPIERIRSVYNFEKKQPEEDSSGAKMAKELDFNEYVAWRMQEKSPATIRNLQTIFLAGVGPQPDQMEKKFTLALETLRSSFLIGIVDRYDESMVVFEEYLKQFFPNIDLSYIRKNITDTDIKASIEDKVKKINQQLDEPLGELVREKNKFDLILYEKANLLLDAKIGEIQTFEKKLNNFQERCKIKQLRLLFNQNKYEKIVESAEEFIKSEIKNVRIYLLYAESLRKLKKYNRALIVYGDIINKFPKNPWAYFYQAEIYSTIGNKKKAKKLFAHYKIKFKEKIEIIDFFKKKI